MAYFPLVASPEEGKQKDQEYLAMWKKYLPLFQGQPMTEQDLNAFDEYAYWKLFMQHNRLWFHMDNHEQVIKKKRLLTKDEMPLWNLLRKMYTAVTSPNAKQSEKDWVPVLWSDHKQALLDLCHKLTNAYDDMIFEQYSVAPTEKAVN